MYKTQCGMYSTVQYTHVHTVQYSTHMYIQYSTVQYTHVHTVYYSTVHTCTYSILQYSTHMYIQYSTVFFPQEVLLIKQYVIVYTINDEQRKKEIKYDQLTQIRKDVNKRINT